MSSRYTIAILTLAGLLAGGVAVGNAASARKDTTAPRKSTANSKTTKSAAARKRAAAARRPRAQMTPTADRISEIQTKLAADGSYHGEANGKWDEATVGAMRDFQSSHGLSPTGKLDALTLQKLGLGSETAGRGAPLPQPEASAIPNSETQRP